MTEAFGANNDVCGLQLCSEIEGGRDAWVAAQAGESAEDAPDVDVAGITVPLHKGYYDGQSAYYIITEASERVHADVITQAQGWTVEYVPSLASVPEDVRSVTYMFTNGGARQRRARIPERGLYVGSRTGQLFAAGRTHTRDVVRGRASKDIDIRASHTVGRRGG